MHAVCMTLVLAASAYPPPGGPLGEAIRTKQTVQVADVAATQAYAERHPAVVDDVELGGVRTNLSVPMLKDNELIGIIAIYRQEAYALGGGAARARRGLPGGQLDARSADRARYHRRSGGADFRHRNRRAFPSLHFFLTRTGRPSFESCSRPASTKIPVIPTNPQGCQQRQSALTLKRPVRNDLSSGEPSRTP